jgi:hypothetical protein
MSNPVHTAYYDAIKADDAYSAELKRVYGRRAQEMRYHPNAHTDKALIAARARKLVADEKFRVEYRLPRKTNPRRRRNPHRRRARSRPTLRGMMHVRRGARGLTDREARRLAQFERRYDRLVGHSNNPRRRKRRRNPRSPLFKLLAQRRGGKRLVYLGGVKFAERGRPVYFRTPEGARTVAKLLRLQFPMLRRYAFGVAGA